MLQKMKQQLIDNIQKAKKKGELTAHKVYEITQDSVVHTAQNIKAGANDLRAITKEAITVSIQSLIDAEEASKEKISAALHGAINGIKQVESKILDSTHKEIIQSKKRLKKEEEKLAQALNEAFEGARESAGNFNEKIKADIEVALVDAKLKSTELLGITRDTVKAAVSNAITIGTEVEKTIVNITRDATSKALAEARFSAKRARKVSETVLSAAVESAEELGSYISETASATAEGIHLGLIDNVESIHQSLDKAGKGVVEFAADDLEQTKKDLNAVGDLFVETLRTVADRSGEVAKNILHELATSPIIIDAGHNSLYWWSCFAWRYKS